MANKFLNKAKRRASWGLEWLSWILLRPIIKKHFQNKPKAKFSIGVTTFMDRFDSCLRPLIKKLTALFPDQQIIIIANGHVRQKNQMKYLKRIRNFCQKYPKIELISYMEPKGLSHLWNTIIDRASNSKVLLLNDDIQIKMNFSRFICFSGMIDQEIATINSSWSHFLISRKLYQQVGPFDEGLKEIGGEDDDYAARLAIDGIELTNFYTETISAKLRKKRKILIQNSYGKDMSFERFGYSNYNSEYLEKKWEMSMEYFEGSVEVPNRWMRYFKLRN